MHTDSGLYLLVVFPGLALASPGNTQARVSFRFRPYPWVPPPFSRHRCSRYRVKQ